FRWRQYVAEWRTESGRHTYRVPCADLVGLLPPVSGARPRVVGITTVSPVYVKSNTQSECGRRTACPARDQDEQSGVGQSHHRSPYPEHDGMATMARS